MRILLHLLLAIFTFAPSVRAQTQYFCRDLNQSINIGIDERAFAGLSLSYIKEFRNSLSGHGVYLQGGIEVPPVLIASSGELNDFNLFMESGTRLFYGKRAGIGTAGRFFLDRQTDVLGTRTALGFQCRAVPFLRINTCMIGVDLAWQQVLDMYVRNSIFIKKTFRDRYPGNSGPKDGWYLATATLFETGLAFGGVFRDRFTGDLSAGLKLVPSRFDIFMDGMMFGQIPFYASVGFGVVLG